MKLADIIKDPDIYPRVQISHKAIESYVESLKAGAKFPPITVQRINSDGKVVTVCLDGWHRLEARKEYNKLDGVDPREEIEAKHWKNEILDKEENLVDLMRISFELNAKQGLRPSQADAKSQLEKIARTPNALSVVWKDIARSFEVTPEWVSECVSSILAEKRMSRDAFMYKLSLLGWTQEEIGEVVGLDQRTVSYNTKELRKFNPLVKSDFYEKHKSAEDIAEYYHLDLPLTWAILLEGKDDIERFKLFGNKDYGTNEEGDPQPRLSDYWVFNKGDPRLGKTDYEGRLFGQQVINILYHYSRQGDLVVDPMAGGGVTVDACLVMNRKCRAYDIDPSKSDRKDIEQHDAREEYPKRARPCDLIILDPPYYKKKEREYDREFTENRDKFIENMGKVAQNCFDALKKGGYLAFIFGQYIDQENEDGSILGWGELCERFTKLGFKGVLGVYTPLSFDTQWHGDPINKAKSYQPWQILPVSRVWYIFKGV